MVTIKDIAAKAGVSTSTASRALNDNSRISQATRQRIQKIAQEMGYVPNDNARNLTRGEANMVGVVLPVTEENALADPFHLDLMRGVSAALVTRNYSMAVVIGQTQAELLNQVKSLAERSKVHHFLIFYSVAHDSVTAFLRDHHLSFVIIGQPIDHRTDRYVDSDNILAGQAATKRLLALHPEVHRPVFLRSSQNWVYEQNREKGYRQELQRRGIQPTIFEAITDQQQLRTLLSPTSPIDGVISADDRVYLQFLHATNVAGCYKNLPTICFNNSRLLGMLMPDVDKVDLRPRQMGAVAVRVLFDQGIRHQVVDFAID